MWSRVFFWCVCLDCILWGWVWNFLVSYLFLVRVGLIIWDGCLGKGELLFIYWLCEWICDCIYWFGCWRLGRIFESSVCSGFWLGNCWVVSFIKLNVMFLKLIVCGWFLNVEIYCCWLYFSWKFIDIFLKIKGGMSLWVYYLIERIRIK